MAIEKCPMQQDTQEEQRVFASVLEKGMLIGLITLPITFFIYLAGILRPAIPLSELPKYWSKNFHTYQQLINENFLHLSHPPTGWAWLKLLGYSDYLNFIGIAILAGVIIPCFIAILIVFIKKGDKIYATIAFLEILVLLLAASGLLKVGGH